MPTKFRGIASTAAIVCLLAATTACGLAVTNETRIERAQAAYDDGDYRSAIIDLRNVLQEEPENRAARLLLGRAAIRGGDAATAEKELRRALELGAPLETVAIDLGQAMLQLRQFDELLEEIRPGLVDDEQDRIEILLLRGDATIGLQLPESARDLYVEVLELDPANFRARLGLASTYVAQQQYEEARRVLDEALAANPDSVPAWLASGSLHLTTGETESAVADLVKAEQLAEAAGETANRVSALSGLVEARLASRDLEGARTAVDQLIGLAPDNLAVKYLTARVAFLEQDFDTALAELQQVVSAAPDYLPAQFLMGAVRSQLGDLGQAEMHLSAVVAAAPDNADARRMLAEVRLRQGRADDAAEILQPVLESGDPDMAALELAARSSMAAGEYDSAIGFLRAFVEKDPDNVAASATLAAALSRQGDFEAAMAIAKDLQSRQPQEALPYALEGELLASRDDYESAAEAYERALALAGNDRGLVVRAFRVRSAGSLTEPEQPLLDYLEQRPDDAAVRLILAQRYRGTGEIDRAITEYEQVLSAQPDNFVALNNLAWEYFQQGDSRAEEIARRAYAQSPDNGSVADTLGWIQVNSGKLEEGIATLRRALELSNGHAEIKYHLAAALAKAGEKAEARDLVKEALSGEGQLISREDAERLLSTL